MLMMKNKINGKLSLVEKVILNLSVVMLELCFRIIWCDFIEKTKNQRRLRF